MNLVMGVGWMPRRTASILAGATTGLVARPRLWRYVTAGTVRFATAVGILLVGAAPVARAQNPTQPPAPVIPTRAAADSLADSLIARLQRAEEAIALLTQQLAAQASSATQTESRARFDLSGRVLINAFRNTARVNNTDVPQFARPDTTIPGTVPGRLLRGGVGAAIRQTTLAGTAFIPRTLGGSFTGDIEVDFYGGQQASPGGRNFPLLRVRTARGMLRWPGAEIMIGQEGPLVSPIEPVSLAAIGVPEFGTAGNLWLWLPQARLTLEAGRTVRVGIQGAVLAPTNGDATGLFDVGIDQGERSRRPALQGRLRLRWGPEDEGGEIGVGAHKAWLASANNESLLGSHAYVVSALIPLGPFEVRGEAFDGAALRGLGGGGIAQGVFGNTPVRTRGGWGQVNLRYRSFLTVGGGCGWDTPRRADLPTPAAAAAATVRLWNNICEGHAIARPDGPLLAAVTYRRTRTKYIPPVGPIVNGHINLTLGYVF